jgi:hypothetical protein
MQIVMQSEKTAAEVVWESNVFKLFDRPPESSSRDICDTTIVNFFDRVVADRRAIETE